MKIHLLISFIIINMLHTMAQSPNWAWAKKAGANKDDVGNCVATDISGNVYVAGYFYSQSITFSSLLTNADNTGNSTDAFIVKYDANGLILWAQRAGGTNGDAITSITTDSFGNVFVTGYFYSTSIVFGSTTLTNTGSCQMFIVKYDSNGTVLFAKKAGGSFQTIGNSLHIDSSNNIYVTGWFGVDLNFGSSTLNSAGSYDVFIAKYSNTGIFQWANRAGGTSNDMGYSVSIDTSTNIYVTGYFQSPSIVVGTTTITNTSSSSSDMFLIKYDSSGSPMWAKKAGGINDEQALSITTDTSGIYVTGYFASPSVIFGSTSLTNAGGIDIFVVKYNFSGSVLWAKREGGSGLDAGNSLTSDGNNIYLTGYFRSPTITFGSTTLTNSANEEMYITKYNAAGNVIWAKSPLGSSYQGGNSVTTFASDIYVTGYYSNFSIAFGTFTLTNNGAYDLFLAKLGSINVNMPEIQSELKVVVYPNPFSYKTNVEFSSILNNGCAIITDILGKEIQRIYFTGKQLVINQSDMQIGIYYLTITNDNRNIVNKKLIVQ